MFTFQDTRTHVVVELYDTERSYVESLQTLVTVRFPLLLLFFKKISYIILLLIKRFLSTEIFRTIEKS